MKIHKVCFVLVTKKYSGVDSVWALWLEDDPEEPQGTAAWSNKYWDLKKKKGSATKVVFYSCSRCCSVAFIPIIQMRVINK